MFPGEPGLELSAGLDSCQRGSCSPVGEENSSLSDTCGDDAAERCGAASSGAGHLVGQPGLDSAGSRALATPGPHTGGDVRVQSTRIVLVNLMAFVRWLV